MGSKIECPMCGAVEGIEGINSETGPMRCDSCGYEIEKKEEGNPFETQLDFDCRPANIRPIRRDKVAIRDEFIDKMAVYDDSIWDISFRIQCSEKEIGALEGKIFKYAEGLLGKYPIMKDTENE